MVSTETFKTIIDQSKDYLDTRIEIARLKMVDRSAEVVSSVVVRILMVIIALVSLIFLSIGFAILIGKLLGSYEYGFLSVGGFYAILFIIVYIQRGKWLKTPIVNSLLNKMLQ